MVLSEEGPIGQDDRLLNSQAADCHAESSWLPLPRHLSWRGLGAGVVLLLLSVAAVLRVHGSSALSAFGRGHLLSAAERHVGRSDHHDNSSETADGWAVGNSGESCNVVCAASGGSCTEQGLYEHNSEADSQAELETIIGRSCNTTYDTSWDLAADVPNIGLNSDDGNCFGSGSDRALSTFSCAKTSADKRVCWCSQVCSSFSTRATCPATCFWGGSGCQASGDKKLMLLQFNPHWECFNTDLNMNKCGNPVSHLVTRFLQDHDIDFANIVEFPRWYRPPAGWTMQCENGDGGETGCIIWKSSRWAQISLKTHCFFGHGRACNVMTFQRLSRPGDYVIVAGTHFPHLETPNLRSGFEKTVHAAIARFGNVTKRLVLLADANARPHQKSDEELMQGIGALRAGSHAKALPWLRNPWYEYNTCCYNIGYDRTYDRIAANFGGRPRLVKDKEYAHASKDYSKAPEFAQIGKPISWAKEKGAYHHPIIAELTYA